MPQVFGCPNCQNPFQVPDDAAGQTFQCPSCESTIEVPASDTDQDRPARSSAPEQTEIFQCPHCSGQFGIEASMYGETLSCPHCQNAVAIGPATPEDSIAGPEIVTDASRPAVSESVEIESEYSHPVVESGDVHISDTADSTPQFEAADPAEVTGEEPEEAQPKSLPDSVFEPQPVDHLLPPRFAVPDPVRFPARRGSSEVILPDGEGGYQAVDANIVTITHNGEVYQLKRLSPEERRRRGFIHNLIAIGVAVLLIYLTLQTLGVLS
jgi:DNA-directed RNA polymerase subunit RPC12/RpoP